MFPGTLAAVVEPCYIQRVRMAKISAPFIKAKANAPEVEFSRSLLANAEQDQHVRRGNHQIGRTYAHGM